MGAMPATQHMTAEEFLALPEPLHRRHAELIDGEIVVHEPLPLHQQVKGELFYALTQWCKQVPARGRTWLPLDVLIDESNVFAPDLLWYHEGEGPDRHGGRPSPVPALAVEVRSPSTWRYDIGPKKAAYEREGLQELWLVDTAASEVLIFRRSAPDAPAFDVALELERDRTLTSPQLDGFELPLVELFPE
jgi:Uma2 family endonuclease